MPTSGILDNRDGNTLLSGLAAMSTGGTELRIATVFSSLDALLLLADALGAYDRVRILFGDDANAEQRRRLLDLLRQRSDADLLAQRDKTPRLTPLKDFTAVSDAREIKAIAGRFQTYPDKRARLVADIFQNLRTMRE